MQIEFTNSAISTLKEEGLNNQNLELVASKIGCACSEESALSLHLKTHPSKEATETISSNLGPIYITPHQKLIIKDDLIINFNPSLYGLELKGKHLGLITPKLPIITD